ncbi:MAG: 50S ribosomal protein L19 [Parcubacteria group bacterium GW2011_GWD2_38_12]|uniref:50S ribosomal protein L19 n=1 Tax=Candidatus Azambacteria bacterium RIFCSPLOWO2_01_FULL_37_9 TaxID=1797297 RepID=A0A1F5C8X6_9BACT|nr:MAG: 50S ribosomal protein L19 [Parcubacteria group bacterium GW2011_GWC2_36_17]KKQ52282.1 MAG: 50S ribosomal protein L19 [Parcubacteria group bacterium GW2011_GWD2_38_12]KKQ58371.1 MAG: 50S ribosomal protein L19 [Parcubacteria group bacterium GW2011_GWD1_38_16]KKQ58566.1 MAG: 50S ribosomal protein L19 [Parcubacteria group bacterium GW2011_GWC1_38_17]OGD39273.1 MAG: 50S ribosomal protein L19 [Candidatus Azambacteria bacterium RIFCSPLOWO2_01_FULL_37_9]
MNKLDIFNKTQQLNLGKFNFKVGDTVKVHQKVKDGDKDRIQIFEGLVIAKKHGDKPDATFTVRKISLGIGVERVFPAHSPLVANVEIVKSAKVSRSKLYFVRETKGKTRFKTGRKIEVVGTPAEIVPEESVIEPTESKELAKAKTE